MGKQRKDKVEENSRPVIMISMSRNVLAEANKEMSLIEQKILG